MPPIIEKNTLFYGDNLDILRAYIPDESIDLIYLDPPFNSNRSYNVLFADESGRASEAQVTAFEDSWHWGPTAEKEYYEMTMNAPLNVAKMIGAMRDLIGANQMMAYLVMMTARLVELHRALKPTGSLYLHCDPTASHYLKIILDAVFGSRYFRNEVIWKRTTAHSDPNKWGNIHDVIFFYTKSESHVWEKIYMPYEDDYLARFRNTDPDGRRWSDDNLTAKGLSGGGYEYDYKGCRSLWRVPLDTMQRLDNEGRLHFTRTGGIRLKRYLDELEGLPIQDVITDIYPINSQAAERLGYPTQKPLALLERIILASTNPGDIVLDPFCGCGTAIAAAEKLNRRWIGIDITHLAISLIRYRLRDMFPSCEYTVIGEPKDLGGARKLSRENRYQFQWWALSLVDARPIGEGFRKRKGKKGKDQGIDGVINVLDDPKGKLLAVIVQIKSGKVSSRDIRDLRGVLDREQAPIAIYITLEPPTRDMIAEAALAGFYSSQMWQKDYPRIQIFTIEELLAGKKPDLPYSSGTFRKAPKVKKTRGAQPKLNL